MGHLQHTARDYGVALAMDHAGQDFQAWAGDGRAAPYFHNVCLRQSFGLGAGASVRGRAYLALGSRHCPQPHGPGLSLPRALRRADAPAAGALAHATDGRVHLSGWALDNAALASVSFVRVDGVAVGTLPRAVALPNVRAVYPNYPGCATVGFEGDVTLPTRDGCTHLVSVVARDADGNESVLGQRLALDG